MDGLSAAASVIAVIQISSQVFDLCRTYYIRVKNARHDIQRLRQDITSLQDLLISILDLAENESPALRILETIVRDDGPLQQCAVELAALVAKLEPEDGKLRQLVFKAVKWPLSCKEVDNILVSIDRYKSSFILALAAGQTTLSLEVGRNVSEIKVQLEDHKIDQERENIVRWLTTTDPSTNLHAAVKNHQPGTGQWLLDSKTFRHWSACSNSLLWLSGIPGCGKTTLSSTIIEHLQKESSVSNKKSAVAYFFFDFKATAKQEASSCLSSITGQLCDQASFLPALIKKLHSRCHSGHSHPNISELQELLFAITKEFSQVFIIIDALDECDIINEKHDILTALSEIKLRNLAPLHMLVTSRPYTDIEEALLPHLSQPALQLQGEYIDSDIRSHILWQLATDSKLKRWPKDVKAEIQESLIQGANGMFRWVACQLDVLKRCLKVGLIRAALNNLPKTLDETYSRLFLDIDEVYRQEAKNALLWLSFSERPLNLAELAEGSIINPHLNCPFSPEERFPNPQYILEILSSLVVVSYVEDVADTTSRATISLAHLSVKEYLVSERIRESSASYFATSYTLAHKHIAECSLHYLLHWGWVDGWIDHTSNVPLLHYSSGNWHKHVNILPEEEQILVNPLVIKLLKTRCQQFKKSQHHKEGFFKLSRWNTSYHDIDNSDPLYYACNLGLFHAVKEILGPDWAGHTPGNEKALFRAIEGGNASIVDFILERGVDPNAKDPHGSHPLHRAVDEANKEIVRVLLKHGALVDTRVGGRTPLHSAVISNQPSVAHLILDAGAEVDISTADRLSQTPLHFAAFYRDLQLLDRLIKMGADVNAQNARGEGALHYAAGGNHLRVMRMLLENGADPDIETEYLETPGAWAMSSKKPEAVELLVKYGAKVGISVEGMLTHPMNLTDFKPVVQATEIAYDRERENSWRYKDMELFFNDLVEGVDSTELVEVIRPGVGTGDVKDI